MKTQSRIIAHGLLGIVLATLLIFNFTIASEMGILDESLSELGWIAAYAAILFAFQPTIGWMWSVTSEALPPISRGVQDE